MGRVMLWLLALAVGLPALTYLLFLFLRTLARMSPWWDQRLGKIMAPLTTWIVAKLRKLAAMREMEVPGK